MKRVLVLLFLALFLGSIISIVLVTAEISVSASSSSPGIFSYISNFLNLKARWDLWVKGSATTAADQSLLGETIKYFVLFIVILLSYSALTYGNFPENTILRLLIAIFVGFLATFAITTPELITALQSYTALGMAFTLFLPILILGFFTLVVADKASPMGIYLQKIVWIIYAAYLLIRSAILFLLVQYYTGFDAASNTIKFNMSSSTWALIKPFVSETTLASISKGAFDQTVMVVQIVISIAVLVIMVFSNKTVLAWLAHEKLDSEVQNQKQRVERSAEYDKVRAEQMQKG